MEKVVVFGASGMLSTSLIAMLKEKYEVHGFNHAQADISNADQVTSILQELQPKWVFNCAAYTKVDDCESNQELAYAVNRDGAGNIAQATARVKGAKMVHVSTDFVFDGSKKEPYIETDEVNPECVYGASKEAGEQAVWDALPQRSLIVRTSWVFGIGGNNFVETMLKLAQQHPFLKVVDDQIGCPTYTRDLAQALIALIEVNAMGWVHFANEGACSWNEFAQGIFKAAGVDIEVQKVTSEEFVRPAKRPSYSVMCTDRFKKLTGQSIRPWQEALKDYLVERTNTVTH